MRAYDMLDAPGTVGQLDQLTLALVFWNDVAVEHKEKCTAE